MRTAAIKRIAAVTAASACILGMLSTTANAIPNTMSVRLNDPTPSTSTTYTFTWSGFSTSTIRCIGFLISTNADGTGTQASSVAAGSAVDTSSTYLASLNTWTEDNTGVANGRLAITNATGAAPTGSARTIVITGVTNPASASTFYFHINTSTATTTSGGQCTGAVADSVSTVAFNTQGSGQTASVEIDPSASLTVATVAGSVVCGAGGPTTTAASTSNTVDLGHITSTASHPIVAQSLQVATNAANGYTVYLSSAAANMVGTATATNYTNHTGSNGTPAAWPAAGTEAFGYHTEDNTLTVTGAGAARFGANNWAAVSTTPVEVMYATVPPSGAYDSNCIAYQAQSANSTRADTYTVTLRYNLVAVF